MANTVVPKASRMPSDEQVVLSDEELRELETMEEAFEDDGFSDLNGLYYYDAKGNRYSLAPNK